MRIFSLRGQIEVEGWEGNECCKFLVREVPDVGGVPHAHVTLISPYEHASIVAEQTMPLTEVATWLFDHAEY